MKVIKTIVLGLTLIFGTSLYAQVKAVKENVDGIYHMSIKNEGLKNKAMQLIDRNANLCRLRTVFSCAFGV